MLSLCRSSKRRMSMSLRATFSGVTNTICMAGGRRRKAPRIWRDSSYDSDELR